VTRATGVLRRAALLLVGSVGSQALAFALSPFLTRLYGPAAFGVFGVFTAATTLVASVASLGLEAAIVIERDPEGARFAYGLSLALAALVALATAAAVALARLAGWTGGMSPSVLAMVPLSVLALGWGQVAVGRALSLDRAFAVAGGRFMRAAGVGIAQIALASVARTGGCLVAGALVGQVAACATVGVLLRRSAGPLVGFAGFGRVVRRHRRLLAWSAPQTLLSNLGASAVPVALAGRFPDPVVGAFSLANRTVQVPAVTLGEAMRQSLLKSASDVAHDPAALFGLLARATAMLALALGAAAVAGWDLAPALFALVFGEPWRTAGSFAALLLVAQAAGIANIPAVTAVTVCGLQRPFFAIQAASTAMRLAALAWGEATGDAWLALACFAAASALTSAAVSLWVGAWLWRRIENRQALA
jgi:O-antigen/teichoic acid export membrane protein